MGCVYKYVAIIIKEQKAIILERSWCRVRKDLAEEKTGEVNTALLKKFSKKRMFHPRHRTHNRRICTVHLYGPEPLLPGYVPQFYLEWCWRGKGLNSFLGFPQTYLAEHKSRRVSSITFRKFYFLEFNYKRPSYKTIRLASWSWSCGVIVHCSGDGSLPCQH